MDYATEKPSIKKVVPKLAYVIAIPNWEWVLGTGIYLDDVFPYLFISLGDELSCFIAARIVTSSNGRDNSNFHLAAGTAMPQASGTSFTQLTAESGPWPQRARRDSL